MKKCSTLSRLSILILLFSFTLFAQSKPQSFSMTDTKGNTYSVTNTPEGLKISGMEGKVVFLEFFGHNCPPCLASIPHLNHLQEKYKDKVVVMAIEVQGYSNAQLIQFAKYKKINYTVISEETASRVVRNIQQRAGWRGSIPFLVAMDKVGDVQFVQAGMLPQASLNELADKLLALPKTLKTSTIEHHDTKGKKQ